MKKLPIGIQSLRKIVDGDYVYVDKTKYVYDLINNASNYFLSRPRRFGKSLLLDTIAEVFRGDRELFKGLWIYESDYSFEKHPIVRLDMSNISTENPEILKKAIMQTLQIRIKEEGFTIAEGIPSHMFKCLIEELFKKYNQKVVVLIDEYDKPILDHLSNPEIAEANRQVIRGFFGILKSSDPYLRFTFITGVSKFTKTSIFSELNNLLDITMLDKYTDICGIRIDELAVHFNEHIDYLKTHKRFKQFEDLHGEILSWYDGYSWDGENRVINPFSLLCFFEQKRFESFWYSSGSPKFLIDIIKKKPESFIKLKNMRIYERAMDTFDITSIELEPLLFQTGYLTVKEVIETRGAPIYVLDIPNYEVREAFNTQVLTALTENSGTATDTARIELNDALESGDLNQILLIFRRLFASIPYNLHINAEAYYHSIFYAVMTVLGFDINVETAVSYGEIDAVLELEDKIYVIEFKYKNCEPDTKTEDKQDIFDKALEEGMQQIETKGYHKKYLNGGKDVYKAAFAFLGRDDIEMRYEVMQ